MDVFKKGFCIIGREELARVFKLGFERGAEFAEKLESSSSAKEANDYYGGGCSPLIKKYKKLKNSTPIDCATLDLLPEDTIRFFEDVEWDIKTYGVYAK